MNYNDRSKKEELKTYASLGLKRTLKSGSQRRRMVERGAQIVIGSGQPEEPQIIVRRDHYTQVRMGVLAEKLRAIRDKGLNLSRESILDYLAPTVERETYRRLLALSKKSSRLETVFLQTHARLPTRGEQKIFNEQDRPVVSSDNQTSQWREDLLDQILGVIEDKRKNSSGRLQTVWAELVGTEIAQQSSLENIESGVAWFRCLSSALSYHLQRRTDLPEKLASKLKLPVRQLKVSY